MRVDRKKALVATVFTTFGLASFHAAMYLLKLRVPAGAYTIFAVGTGFLAASISMYKKACSPARPDSSTSEMAICEDDEPEGIEMHDNLAMDVDAEQRVENQEDRHDNQQVERDGDQQGDLVGGELAEEEGQVREPANELQVEEDENSPDFRRQRSGSRCL